MLGADDGVVSTASLVVGVAAAQATQQSILVAGLAGLAAGAMSMAAGEYVSVRSQADSERAELERERTELNADVEGERQELAGIYVRRGLDPVLAREVAVQLMAHDPLGAHARDELGISQAMRPRPLQAAFASACSFSAGAAVPLLTIALTPASLLIPTVAAASLVALAVLGGLAAWVGGAPIAPGAIRVTFWGALAMAVTAGVGMLFGTPP
ncbi:MAG: VIT family protein [Burkholderiales bacterium]